MQSSCEINKQIQTYKQQTWLESKSNKNLINTVAQIMIWTHSLFMCATIVFAISRVSSNEMPYFHSNLTIL